MTRQPQLPCLDILERLKAVTERFENLDHSSSSLLDKLQNACVLQSAFDTAHFNMNQWLEIAEGMVADIQDAYSSSEKTDLEVRFYDLSRISALSS